MGLEIHQNLMPHLPIHRCGDSGRGAADPDAPRPDGSGGRSSCGGVLGFPTMDLPRWVSSIASAAVSNTPWNFHASSRFDWLRCRQYSCDVPGLRSKLSFGAGLGSVTWLANCQAICKLQRRWCINNAMAIFPLAPPNPRHSTPYAYRNRHAEGGHDVLMHQRHSNSR